jgi:O-antigen/teichoic acid export membrane protein
VVALRSSFARIPGAGKFQGLLSWKRLTGASSVLIGSSALINVLRIVNTMLLTRLLAPSDFGLVGMISSIYFTVNLVLDAGVEHFVVRHERGEDPGFLDAIWTLHFGRGVLATLITSAVAIPAAWALAQPRIVPFLIAMSLTATIDGAASLSVFLAVRNRLVRRLSSVEFIAFLAQFASGLIAAYFLRSAWALIVSMVTYSCVRTAASYIAFPMPWRRFTVSRPIAAELWKFSRVIGMSSLLTIAISQIDKLVLARAFTLAQFGVYAIASNLSMAPLALVALYGSRIVYPQLAETWRIDKPAMRETYYGMRGLVFYGFLFAAGGLIGGAHLLIRILYDPRYLGAAYYLAFLALTPALTMLTRCSNELLIATGRTATILTGNIFRICWLVGFGLIGLVLRGPIGVVIALATIEFTPYLYNCWVMRRMDLLDMSEEVKAVLIVAVGTAVGFGVALAGSALLDRFSAYIGPHPFH